jgi:hypothetical protein
MVRRLSSFVVLDNGLGNYANLDPSDQFRNDCWADCDVGFREKRDVEANLLNERTVNERTPLAVRPPCKRCATYWQVCVSLSTEAKLGASAYKAW